MLRRLLNFAEAARLSIRERLKTRRSRRELVSAPIELADFLTLLELPGDEAAALARLDESFAAGFPLFPGDRAAAEGLRECLAEHCPGAAEAILRRAAEVEAGVFELLGSGPVELGEEIDWLTDFKTGVSWPIGDHQDLPIKVDPEGPEDIKVPWELSRFQEGLVTARAYALTGDERHARVLRRRIESWWDQNPYGRTCNWKNAMEVAIRAWNWLAAFALCRRSEAFDDAFRLRFYHSLTLHAFYIAGNLEVYGTITSNHYLSDGVGLHAIAAALPEGPQVAAWRALGRKIAFGEMTVQVHSDGVNYENCPSYHRLVLELFLAAWLLERSRGGSAGPEFDRQLEAMFEFIRHSLTPEDRVPVVGDADDGRLLILGDSEIGDHRYLLSTAAVLFQREDFKHRAGALAPDTLWWLGPAAAETFAALEAGSAPTSRHFEASNFIVLHGGEEGDRDQVFIDLADIGIGNRGSHGHDDLLSFTLALGGREWLVDAGPFVYTADLDKRFLARSARSHNLVVVDDAEMSGLSRDYAWITPEPAEAAIHRVELGGERELVDAEHHGYRRLPEPVTHRRRWLFDRPRRRLVVEDRLTGEGRHQLRLQWLFHELAGAPALELTAAELPVEALLEELSEAFGDPASDNESGDRGSAPVCLGASCLRRADAPEGPTLRVTVFGPAETRSAFESALRSPSYDVEVPATRLASELEAALDETAPLRFVTVFEKADD